MVKEHFFWEIDRKHPGYKAPDLSVGSLSSILQSQISNLKSIDIVSTIRDRI